MLFNAQSAMMMATKALKLPACCHRTTHATLQHTVTSLYTSHFSHISPVSALMFSLSPLTLSVCVRVISWFCRRGLLAATLVLVQRVSSSTFCGHSVLTLSFLLPLPLPPSSTRYCFFCFFISYIFNTFFSRLCLCFLCAFCVALTARAINFNCAFYASHSPPSLSLPPAIHSLCCLLFCFIMQKKSTGWRCCCLFCTSATPRLTPFDGKFL